MRTRTTVLQAHTHQWIETFAGAGNCDYRGELLRAIQVIGAYAQAQSMPLRQVVIRLDGQYGNGAIVADLAGLAYVMRGKDYHLLDLPQVQARLNEPPDAQTTHPETGTRRALFDVPDLVVTATGERCRVIVATHPASSTPASVGVTREEMVYELFFTVLPSFCLLSLRLFHWLSTSRCTTRGMMWSTTAASSMLALITRPWSLPWRVSDAGGAALGAVSIQPGRTS